MDWLLSVVSVAHLESIVLPDLWDGCQAHVTNFMTVIGASVHEITVGSAEYDGKAGSGKEMSKSCRACGWCRMLGIGLSSYSTTTVISIGGIRGDTTPGPLCKDMQTTDCMLTFRRIAFTLSPVQSLASILPLRAIRSI